MAGCQGSGDIQFTSLHASAIDPPATTVHRYKVDECYWWVEDGTLHLAMEARRRTLMPGRLGRIDLCAWMPLGELPAGRARNYPIGREGMTAILTAPLDTHRFEAYAGIVGVVMQEDGRLEASFRVWAIHRPGFSPLAFLGQSSAGQFLFFGRLRAVKDAARGPALRERCG